MTTTEQPGTSIRDRLAGNHVRLTALFEELLRRLALDDRDETRAAWNEFERTLATHLDAEDALMLPVFAAAQPEEAAAIRAEHEKIRAKLLELGVAVDLHYIRANVAADFVRVLREHAAREDSMMYPWAEAHLESAVRGAIIRKLWTV